MKTKNFFWVFRSAILRSTRILMIAAIFGVFVPTLTLAHGVVGDRIFLSPIVGNDAFPDNAFGLNVRRSDYGFSLMPTLEKQLSDDSSLLIAGGWARIASQSGQPQTMGAEDLSIYFRQAAYVSTPHEFELTVSPILVLPTGDRKIADQGYTHLGGEILLGKGLGDLPHFPSFKYLRPFAVQTEVGYTGRIQGPANSDVFCNLEVEYPLQYLDRFVGGLSSSRPWTELVPYLQANFAQSFIASRLTTSPDFRITPGVGYLGDYCELSVGTQIALNGAAPSGDRVAVIGLAEVFYDNIFPALGWSPF